MIQSATTRRVCGEFDNACEMAIRFTNWLNQRRRINLLDTCQRFLTRAGWIHATFGVEIVELVGRKAYYINTGDTYTTTILEEDGILCLTSWGDWVETVESKYCESTGTVRCGYCSEFTPIISDWSSTTCKHSGNLVGG